MHKPFHPTELIERFKHKKFFCLTALIRGASSYDCFAVDEITHRFDMSSRRRPTDALIPSRRREPSMIWFVVEEERNHRFDSSSRRRATADFIPRRRERATDGLIRRRGGEELTIRETSSSRAKPFPFSPRNFFAPLVFSSQKLSHTDAWHPRDVSSGT